MIIKTIKVLRNHWKKSIFFTSVIGYGSNYFYTSHKINCLMKDYCEEALKYGEQRLSVFAQPKHITVILNPRSKKSKCRKHFNDYVAPILHCAGYKVSMVETENQGHACQLMEIMNNTDAVLIAGGSGTIQEAITGLLRREDTNQVANNLPIAFLPLGTNNHTFKRIYDFTDLNISSKRFEEVKILAESTMKILNDKRTQLNVIRIHNLDTQKTVFSLNKFEFGILNELSRKFKLYWYLSDYLAPYYVHLKATLFKNLNTFELGSNLNLNYRESCAGCSNCYKEFINQDKLKQRSTGWFNIFKSIDQKKNDQILINYENKLKNTINTECGKWKTIKLDRLMNLQIENNPRLDRPEIKLRIFKNSDELNKNKFFNYLKNYPNQEVDGQNNLELNVRDLKFDISSLNIEDSQTNEEEVKDKKEVKDEKSVKLNYFIDDENYDVKQNLELNSKFRKILTFY